jgi:hypothetical protein
MMGWMWRMGGWEDGMNMEDWMDVEDGRMGGYGGLDGCGGWDVCVLKVNGNGRMGRCYDSPVYCTVSRQAGEGEGWIRH